MQGQRLLVIDDQRLDRAIVTHAATQAGFQVSAAASINETRDWLEKGNRFDFIVLDLSLGNEDGLAALPIIALYNNSAVIVLASGFDGRVLAASQRLASTFGLLVAGVLQKPIQPTALQQLLFQRPQAISAGGGGAVRVPPEQIRLAISSGQIEPWFQPKTSLASGAIIGAEALARWVRADGRSVSPAEFVKVAELTGCIEALTDTILDQSLAACADWRQVRPEVRVAINVSPLLLDDPRLPDRIEEKLQTYGVPAGSVILEITEGSGIPDTPQAIGVLTRLRIRGVHLSVDDFGTGHSSLLSLVRMPFDEMKIDQAFIQEAISSRDARKVVRASASLGRELGLNVVAEGIETDAMAQLATEAGCHVGQGWLYGRAVPLKIFRAMLTEKPEAAAQARDVVA